MKKLILFIFCCLCFSFLGCEEENEMLVVEEIKPTFDTVYSIKIKFLDKRCIKKYGVSNEVSVEIGETDLIDLNSNELTVMLDSFIINPQFRVYRTVQKYRKCRLSCSASVENLDLVKTDSCIYINPNFNDFKPYGGDEDCYIPPFEDVDSVCIWYSFQISSDYSPYVHTLHLFPSIENGELVDSFTRKDIEISYEPFFKN